MERKIKTKSADNKKYKNYKRETYGTSYFRKVIILADPVPPVFLKAAFLNNFPV